MNEMAVMAADSRAGIDKCTTFQLAECRKPKRGGKKKAAWKKEFLCYGVCIFCYWKDILSLCSKAVSMLTFSAARNKNISFGT
ncbi:hypothetical protein XENTR_v10004996 [Xenopus tropicalis]|nr:hypothetical protein XENTR_v10004996 [Xenopus tropicalis]